MLSSPPPPPSAAPPLVAPGWSLDASMWAGCAEPEPDAVRYGACCPPMCGRCGGSTCTRTGQSQCCVRPLVRTPFSKVSCDVRGPPCLLARYMRPVAKAHSEPFLHHVIASLFALGLVGHGAILDAGANDGGETAFLATLQLERTVIAVEPILANVAAITSRLLPLLPNVRLFRGGLSNRSGVGSYSESNDRADPGEWNQLASLGSRMTAAGASRKGQVAFNITTVDKLMASYNLPLALAHWDVEGGELDLLRGARRVIARDRPLFIVESAVHTRKAKHARLLKYVRQELGYEAHEIPEHCGFLDCRNYLCVPPQLTERFARHRAVILEGYRPLFP